MFRKIYLAIALLTLAYGVKAEGFGVNLQGVKQTGMGHTGVALTFDASVMQWNPGGLAMLKSKYSFSVGGFATFTKVTFNNKTLGNATTDNPVKTPFYFYGATKVSDKLAFGLGVYTPFGNTVKWGNKWQGRYLIQDIALKAVYIQPTVSYKITDKISVGAGLNIVKGSVDLNKAFPIINPKTKQYITDGSVNINGTKFQVGYNVGVYVQATENLSFGVAYRSQVDVNMGHKYADATFTLPKILPAPFHAAFPNGSVATALPLPSTLTVGFAYNINEKWLISADVNFNRWSAYKNLVFDFEKDPTQKLYSDSKRSWKNAATYRIGARYQVCKKLKLYAGAYYDETPTNKEYYSPETPGANKISLSTGFSYQINKHLSVDATILYNKGSKNLKEDSNIRTKMMYRGKSFKGEYESTAWLPGIGITYNF